MHFRTFFWGVSHVKNSKKWKWDSGRPPPCFFKIPTFSRFFGGGASLSTLCCTEVHSFTSPLVLWLVWTKLREPVYQRKAKQVYRRTLRLHTPSLTRRKSMGPFTYYIREMLTRRGGGVSQMLTMADGGEIQEPLILADVICELPLMGQLNSLCPNLVET